jgi:hypothetical protein
MWYGDCELQSVAYWQFLRGRMGQPVGHNALRTMNTWRYAQQPRQTIKDSSVHGSPPCRLYQGLIVYTVDSNVVSTVQEVHTRTTDICAALSE